MNPPEQTEFPDTTSQENVAAAPSAGPVILEGMKVLFDDKVGLYPVDLVAKEKINTNRRINTS